MKTVLKTVSAVCLLIITIPAQSQSLWDSLVNGKLNFYEDQDREVIFDIDGDGSLSAGDVIIGYVRIDDHVQPVGPHVDVSNDLYAVFSIQVEDVVPTVGATTTTYVIEFGSTTVAGLTLADLGVTNADAAGDLVAIYEDVNLNLIYGFPSDVNGDSRLTIFDFISEITNDTLDLLAGVETDVDHWVAWAEVSNLADPISNLVLLESATLPGGVPDAEIRFHAGLGITWARGYAEDCTDGPHWKCFDRLVADTVESPVVATLHELTIQNGVNSGVSDLVFDTDADGDPDTNPFFSGAAAGGSGQWNGINFYGLSSNADFGVYPLSTSLDWTKWIIWTIFFGVFILVITKLRKPTR